MTDAPLPEAPTPPPSEEQRPACPLRAGLERLSRRWQLAVGALLAVVLLSWIAAWVPQAFRHWSGRESIREQAARARKSDLTYLQALRDPNAIFKPVRWHLTHTPGEWYYEGNHSEPVAWAAGEPDLPITGQMGTPNDVVVLATVVGSDGKKVTLSFIGRD